MDKLLRFLVLACVVQVAGAQGLFKGFTPDENGTNLDAPVQNQKVTPGTVIKDCVECPEMVLLPSGRFLMGSLPDEPFSKERIFGDSERPQHPVQIQSFAIGKYKVTEEQWYSVMGDISSFRDGRKLPIVNVSRDEIQLFIFKLNEKTGRKYRLPSEAEWEYAAKAGTTTKWSFGDDESKLGEYAWYAGNSEEEVKAVGQKLPNNFGLFDMHGNVLEETADCWHLDYVGAPTDGSAWITDCAQDDDPDAVGKDWVLRGGAANMESTLLRSSVRFGTYPHPPYSDIGFRLARDL
jgi:formylglycine-generating enzyme required for sulfatase activity